MPLELELGGRKFKNRFFLGSARFPNLKILSEAIRRSSTEIVTVSLRRDTGAEASGFWQILQECNVTLLPNTAGCQTVHQAVVTARMAREVFHTNWIKLETVGDDYTLQPDPFALVEAAEILCREGFEVFPYTTDDLVVAAKLVSVGCRILMPWAAPIGSARGVQNPWALKALRARFPQVKLIVDAGIGTPSHAAQAMELGYDAVLLNSAVSLAQDPCGMAEAFSLAIQAGRLAYLSGPILPRDFATPSTPVVGTPFWHEASRPCL